MSRTTADLSVEDSMSVDIEFHLQLARTARNPLMEALVGLASEWTRDERVSTHSDAHWRGLSAHWHAAVLEAVAARDPEAARAAMSEHLAEVRRRIFEARTDPG